MRKLALVLSLLTAFCSQALAQSDTLNINGSASIAGTFRFGLPDATSTTLQTIGSQNVLAGTSNTAGSNLVFAGSKGTGTGIGGSIIFQTARAGTTGTTQNPETTAMTIDGNIGNLGINTAPTANDRLTIEDGTGNNQLRLRYTGKSGFSGAQVSSGAFLFNLQDNQNLQFTTNNGSGAFLTISSGSVSIGASPVNTGANTLYVQNHILAGSTSPTVSSCGTSPGTPSGSDNFGKVVAGSGVLTSCVINFGTAWGTAPSCTVSSPTAIASLTVTASTTQLTIGGSSLTSDTLSWVCGSTS